MKINNLAKLVYGPEQYAAGVANKYFGGWDNVCTGKTTANLLRIISVAMASPGKEVPIYEGWSHIQTSTCPGGLQDQLVSLLNKLEFKFFEISKAKNTLVFNPFEEYEEPVDNKNTVEQLYNKLSKAAEERDLDAVETYSKAIQRLN